MTLLTRRSFAAGATTLAVLPAAPAMAQGGSRTFRFLRGTTPIGTSVVTVQRTATGMTATSDIDIKVKGLGIITLYRYALQCTEVYDAQGDLVSMNGTCDDDGTPHFVNVTRTGDGLSINGSFDGSATASPSSGAASYWRRDALTRTPWISTQSGERLAVTVSQITSAEAPAGTTAYRATNGTDYTIDLFYDSRGEWVGGAFDAKGDRATMELVSETGALQI